MGKSLKKTQEMESTSRTTPLCSQQNEMAEVPILLVPPACFLFRSKCNIREERRGGTFPWKLPSSFFLPSLMLPRYIKPHSSQLQGHVSESYSKCWQPLYVWEETCPQMDCIYLSGYTFNLTCLAKLLQRLLRMFQERKEGAVRFRCCLWCWGRHGRADWAQHRAWPNAGDGLCWWLARGAPCFSGLSALLHETTRKPMSSLTYFTTICWISNPFHCYGSRSLIPFWTDENRTSVEPLCLSHELEWRQQRLQADKGFCPQSGQKLLKPCPLLKEICWFTPPEGQLSSTSFNTSRISCKQLDFFLLYYYYYYFLGVFFFPLFPSWY